MPIKKNRKPMAFEFLCRTCNLLRNAGAGGLWVPLGQAVQMGRLSSNSNCKTKRLQQKRLS